MIRKYGSTVLGCIGVALWLAALFMLASAVQNSEKFAKWLPWILLVNISGLLTLFVVAITWLSVALGLNSQTPEAASNAPMPLILLPFLGSGFVPTDSMPTALRWFAEYQPFTPIMETLRGLLLGTPIGNSAAIATAWCAGIAAVSYLWAKNTFNKA